ncbi:hypothetical protein RF11_11968 [Thelohanellus kitauei]|uniref:Tc1-like transposase DDE domain-containing protein n=1 Tax=Thelohanellus kitauei TaxID=669202 RepID=A0A0C2MX29_THEKT|nr:hypothetical protein RF11_11968 [Thelohanellus kitauei]
MEILGTYEEFTIQIHMYNVRFHHVNPNFYDTYPYHIHYLPRYSPCFSPCEEIFSQLKSLVRGTDIPRSATENLEKLTNATFEVKTLNLPLRIIGARIRLQTEQAMYLVVSWRIIHSLNSTHTNILPANSSEELRDVCETFKGMAMNFVDVEATDCTKVANDMFDCLETHLDEIIQLATSSPDRVE